MDAPAPSEPLYGAFATATVPELPVGVPLQSDCNVAPDGNVIDTVQLVMAPPPACTVTPPWKPPGHVPADAYVAVQASAASAEGAATTAAATLATAAQTATHLLDPEPGRL